METKDQSNFNANLAALRQALPFIRALARGDDDAAIAAAAATPGPAILNGLMIMTTGLVRAMAGLAETGTDTVIDALMGEMEAEDGTTW